MCECVQLVFIQWLIRLHSGQLPTKIYDRKGRLIIFRTALRSFINHRLTVYHCTHALDPFMAQFIYEAQMFVIACTSLSGNEARGSHFYQISGHDRNNKRVRR